MEKYLALNNPYIKALKIQKNIMYVSYDSLLDNLYMGTDVFEIINTQYPFDTDGDKKNIMNLEIIKCENYLTYDTVVNNE